MSNLHEVLEICLQDIEQGADLDTVLFRYPELAHELRPILEASVNAKSLAIPAPSVEVVRRNRVKVLQHAAQLRAAKARPSKRVWFTSLRRVAVTLAVVATLFVSGTRLVSAASTTVPGDNLYPVKRTWEDVLVLLTFNLQQRETLEVEHENERHHELQELFAERRSAEVEFSGLVTSQTETEWVVSGIPVVISPQTEIHDLGIVVGSAIRVKGQTQANNAAVVADEIGLLPPGSMLPDLGDETGGETESHEGEDRQIQESPTKGSEDELPQIEETQSPGTDSEQKEGTSNGDRGGSDSYHDGDQRDDSSPDDKGSDDSSSHESSDDSGGGNSSSDGGGD